MNQVENYGLQNVIYNVLAEHPDWRGYLEEMVAVEHRKKDTPYFIGWSWQEVHTPISILNAIITRGIIDQVYNSRQGGKSLLHSLADTEAALDSTDVRVLAREPVVVEDLFDMVIGHERAKEILRLALKAASPVHVLLKGPPGTAKTLFLSDIARLPGGEYYVGSSATKSGIVGLLLQVRPRYLIIDELDKMATTDQSALLTLMETGMVTRLMHGVQQREQMDTRVFAGANVERNIQDPLLSRFAKLDIPPYSAEQFVNVAQAILMKREGCGPKLAELIAREVVRHTKDIRDAVRVAKMAGNDRYAAERVMTICGCLWGGPAKITALPRGE